MIDDHILGLGWRSHTDNHHICIQLILILVGQLSSKKPHWPLGFPSSLWKVPTEIVAAFVAKQQVLSWKYFSCWKKFRISPSLRNEDGNYYQPDRMYDPASCREMFSVPWGWNPWSDWSWNSKTADLGTPKLLTLSVSTWSNGAPHRRGWCISGWKHSRNGQSNPRSGLGTSRCRRTHSACPGAWDIEA